jgi:SAM-dependent methyltransferase
MFGSSVIGGRRLAEMPPPTRTTPDDRDFSTPRRYFEGLAETYASFRPSYPPDAIAAMLDDLPAPARVADIGCGTGISTQLLLDAGAIVTGIDPSVDMLARAEREIGASAGCIFREGTGESTGLADDAVDLVVCAQSFHWLDAPRALDEFHRILRPGGRLALAWNVRRGDDPVAAGYQAIVLRAQADAETRNMLTRRIRSYPIDDERYHDVRTLVFDNPQVLDWEGFIGRIHSASYYPVDGPLREELDTAMRELYEANEFDDRVTVGQRTEVTVATV